MMRPQLRLSTLLLLILVAALALGLWVQHRARVREVTELVAELQRERARAEANHQKALAAVDQYYTMVAERAGGRDRPPAKAAERGDTGGQPPP